jgi:hypothetical protein
LRFWRLDDEGVYYSEGPSLNVYAMPPDPYRYVPLRWRHLAVGNSHGVVVFVEPGRLGTIEHGE